MKEFFIARKFGAEALVLLEKIAAILERYAAEGYDLSLRQLYYQLVAANVVPNSERSYKNIGNLVSDARLAGLIDWDMISDRGRTTIANSHWNNPQEIVEACAAGFRIDKWATQPSHVEVMVEKQALEGVLVPVCRELDIAFSANKGYSSSSALYEAGKRLKRALDDDKEVHLIYLGDHDPSGIDMTRDVGVRLNLFANVIGEVEVGDPNFDLKEKLDAGVQGIRVHRIALNMPQIEELNPPENPAKLTDSRATAYIQRFGESSWELDAIEPKALARLVRNKVFEIRDADLWDEAVKKEKAMRDELLRFANEKKGRK